MQNVILGCGDIGRRIVKELLSSPVDVGDIAAYVNSQTSQKAALALGVDATVIDLDSLSDDLGKCNNAQVYYTIAPQKNGVVDQRTQAVLRQFDTARVRPNKVVLISTTGVYGDCDGDWVDETSPVKPTTERAQRRLDSEQQWLAWGQDNSVGVVVLRVPGIYAFSRIPRERLAKRIPVVRAAECGFTNRIHADDLARICTVAMASAKSAQIFNATDGRPGTISEYLMAAAEAAGLPPLPEISMQEAQSKLSVGMLSYLGESRKISNEKMLCDLEIELLFPDFKKGLYV